MTVRRSWYSFVFIGFSKPLGLPQATQPFTGFLSCRSARPLPNTSADSFFSWHFVHFSQAKHTDHGQPAGNQAQRSTTWPSDTRSYLSNRQTHALCRCGATQCNHGSSRRQAQGGKNGAVNIIQYLSCILKLSEFWCDPYWDSLQCATWCQTCRQQNAGRTLQELQQQRVKAPKKRPAHPMIFASW